MQVENAESVSWAQLSLKYVDDLLRGRQCKTGASTKWFHIAFACHRLFLFTRYSRALQEEKFLLFQIKHLCFNLCIVYMPISEVVNLFWTTCSRSMLWDDICNADLLAKSAEQGQQISDHDTIWWADTLDPIRPPGNPPICICCILDS